MTYAPAARLTSFLVATTIALSVAGGGPLAAQTRHKAKATSAKSKQAGSKHAKSKLAKSKSAKRTPVTSRPAPAEAVVPARTDSIYVGTQVDTLAEPNPATFVPRYPPALRAQQVPGTVVVQFVVDTTGRVDMRTFKVVSSSDPAFTTAVRATVARTDFLPALLDGRKVRQLYEQPFTFAVDSVSRARGAGRAP